MPTASKPLRVGSRAPAFTALTDSDEKLKLSSLRGRIVVLFFYPKDDTAG
jgi:peroxiredoxin Q/BCP